MAFQNRSWEFDLEEGLDAAAIVLLPSPSARSYEARAGHKIQRHNHWLDNSGSMRGRLITIAVTADILARHWSGVKVEILASRQRPERWAITQARRRWKTSYARRLNDLRHIIYKSADQPMPRT